MTNQLDSSLFLSRMRVFTKPHTDNIHHAGRVPIFTLSPPAIDHPAGGGQPQTSFPVVKPFVSGESIQSKPGFSFSTFRNNLFRGEAINE